MRLGHHGAMVGPLARRVTTDTRLIYQNICPWTLSLSGARSVFASAKLRMSKGASQSDVTCGTTPQESVEPPVAKGAGTPQPPETPAERDTVLSSCKEARRGSPGRRPQRGVRRRSESIVRRRSDVRREAVTGPHDSLVEAAIWNKAFRSGCGANLESIAPA